MDAVKWVMAYYPAYIILFGVLSQFLVYVPGNENSPPLTISTAKKTPARTDGANVDSQKPESSRDYPAQLSSEGQNSAVTIHSRGTIWFSAFWLSLQLYNTLRMGNMISIAEQERAVVVWPITIIIFFPTFMFLMSIVRLGEALERDEAHQKSSTGPKKQYFLNVEILFVTVCTFLCPGSKQAGWSHGITTDTGSSVKLVLQGCCSTMYGDASCQSPVVKQAQGYESD